VVAPQEQAPQPSGSSADPCPGDRRTGWGDVAIEALKTSQHMFDRLVDDVFGNTKKFDHFKIFCGMVGRSLGAVAVIVLAWRGLDGVLADAHKLVAAVAAGGGVGGVMAISRATRRTLARRRATEPSAGQSTARPVRRRASRDRGTTDPAVSSELPPEGSQGPTHGG